jgi:hypothetical protein
MAIRDDIIKEIELRLGGGMVDVELDRDHYDVAINRALAKFRQRSSNAVEESFMVMPLTKEVDQYTLPEGIISVRQIFRRITGGINTSGIDLEPFEAGYLNTYLLHSARAGSVTTFEFYAQYRELLGRMFGAHMMFTYNPRTRLLTLHRHVRADDSVILWCYNYRTDESLLTDTYGSSWLKDYATAHCKMMLGEARSKFAQIAGPQGGTSLNGENLKTEAMADLEKLEEDLKQYVDGGTPLTFVIG